MIGWWSRSFVAAILVACQAQAVGGDTTGACTRANNVCVEKYSLSSKLHRSRVLLRQWLLWWQHKSLELEMFCCDSRLRLLEMIDTVLGGLLVSGRCLGIVAIQGILLTSMSCFSSFFSLVHVFCFLSDV